MSIVTLTVKEAEALDAEIAQLEHKAALFDKVAREIADILRDENLISPHKYNDTIAALSKEGGIAAYFKKACQLYKSAESKTASVSRIGRESKQASTTSHVNSADALREAAERFAQRVLALSR